MSMPRATVRLQFHKDFTFDDAAAAVGYYAALGVSHIYASPMLTARSGSTHGYDIVDPTQINPELGGEAGLRRLAARLRAAGMGLIADIVPNHMGVGSENPWWRHVLEWGQQSRYAGWFDIDWQAADPALCGKVLAPFLGRAYGDALCAGEIQLRFDQDSGRIFAAYYAQRFPLAPASYAHVLRSAGSARLEPVIAAFEQIGRDDSDAVMQASADAAFLLLREIGGMPEGAADIDAALMRFSAATADGLDALHQLLERQHYRLAWWRNAAEEINWRRFFEVSDLAGVRVEQDEVFEATHALIFRLYAEGLIDGVRIDHVDGLADPGGYCRKLRQRLIELASARPSGLPDRPYIVVEKILAADEQLRADWKVDGSTGYEFMDQAGALLHDPDGAAPLTALWTELAGDAIDFDAEVKAARRQLLAENFVGEFDAVARVLHAIARAGLHTRDVSSASIRRVLTELLVHFPVYRTYAGDEGRDPLDRQVFELAARHARQSLRPADRPLLHLVGRWLGGAAPHAMERGDVRELCLRAIMRFQQLTPPLAAKSVEDTAFYRYGRLLSRNEVGADPARFSISVEDFHRSNSERARCFPDTLLATATHDHKRGEDVRARLAVLSEMPRQWEQAVRRWMALHARWRAELADEEGGPASASVSAPRAADELMLYQMLAGAWPLDLAETDRTGMRSFAERIDQWQTKALREAKRVSSWAQPDERYETACRDFLFRILDTQADNTFLKELAAWVRKIAPAGAVNSLTQTLLRLGSPGIPDLYQGTEFWDFSLVDPDNRRPVDHAAREQALMNAPPAITNTENWKSGQLKQQIVRHALALRAREPGLFARGEYVPLAVEGACAKNAIAFLRRYRDSAAIIVATRFPAHMVQEERPAVASARWKDTAVVLPDGLATIWTDIFTGVCPACRSDRLALAEVLNVLPVALLSTWLYE
jgi:(1->4)-alpha-D-glucan 1-alpha-D-glucosylmutase